MINVDFILRTKQKIIINFEKKIIIFLFIKLFFSLKTLTTVTLKTVYIISIFILSF